MSILVYITFAERGIDEPYRMFTSRAEYRLSLRSDNADRRLTDLGKSVGLVDNERWHKYRQKVASIDQLKTYCKDTNLAGSNMWDLLRKPNSELAEKLSDNEYVKNADFDKSVVNAVVIDAKYEGYLKKQEKLVAHFRNMEKVKIPADIDYAAVDHLRAEAREKLTLFKPDTFAQASRISGITPADITILRIHLKKTSGK